MTQRFCRFMFLVLFVLSMNILSGVIVYRGVLYFEKSMSIYYPGYSSLINDDVTYRRPEDDWAIPGNLDP